MLLEHKVAVIYGGGGVIGGAVVRAFAREGAKVFLAGRTPATLDATAADIHANGGSTASAVVDALDEAAVNAFVDNVAAQAGSVDISFNAIAVGDIQQPLIELVGRGVPPANRHRDADPIPDRQGGGTTHDRTRRRHDT
jgi:NAD(P)-dependent dehydrogenase (short-subunit alcohol dehydrogenase family)